MGEPKRGLVATDTERTACHSRALEDHGSSWPSLMREMIEPRAERLDDYWTSPTYFFANSDASSIPGCVSFFALLAVIVQWSSAFMCLAKFFESKRL